MACHLHIPRSFTEALERWHECSRLEGQAIDQEDWPRLMKCQDNKAALRESIESLLPGNPGNAPPQWDVSQWPESLQRTVGQLISLERENAAKLATRRAAATEQKAELEGALLNLRRVQRSYVRPEDSSWTSYS